MAAAGMRRRRSGLAMNRGRFLLARAISIVASAVALILVVGIALVLLKANPGNSLVGTIHDAAAWLAGPFDQMFDLERKRIETAVNWGIAAVVWFVAGRLLARLVAR